MHKKLLRKLSTQLLIFLLLFGALYGTMQLLIGISVPGGRFDWPWISHYFNVPAALRYSLLKGGSIVLDIMNMDTYIFNSYHLRLVDGKGIRMVYSCMGYGIMSFWVAFAWSFCDTWKQGLKWMFIGLAFIWSINVLRIALLIVATNKQWPMPLDIDHHTWFNIVVYLGIGFLMYGYDRSAKRDAEIRDL